MNSSSRIGAIVLLLLGAACLPLSSSVSETPGLLTETETAVDSSDFIATSTPPTKAVPLISTSTAIITPTILSIQPPVEARCPITAEVSLSKLGLSSTSRLIVVPVGDETRTFWSLVGSDQTLKRISHTTFRGKPVSFAETSPDQKWFAFYALSERNEKLDLWVSSMDGQKQWPARTGLEVAESFIWINNKQMLFLPSGHIWPEVSMDFNPFSLETTSLAPLYLELGAYAFSSDTSEVIYLEGFPYSWKLYDYQKDRQQNVLPWFDGRRIQPSSFVRANWAAEGISVALMDSQSLELAVNLSPSSLNAPGVTLYRILFPEESKWWSISWWSSDGHLFAFKRTLDDPKNLSSPSAQFRILDMTKWILYDYCLPQELAPGGFDVSADERFAAWSGLRKGERTLGTIVMELATGRWAWLPAVEVIDWGELIPLNGI